MNPADAIAFTTGCLIGVITGFIAGIILGIGWVFYG